MEKSSDQPPVQPEDLPTDENELGDEELESTSGGLSSVSNKQFGTTTAKLKSGPASKAQQVMGIVIEM